VLGAFEFPPLSHLFEWPDLAFEDTPFAINKVVLCILASSALVLAFFFAAASRSRKGSLVPSGVQNVAEAGLELVEKNIALEVMGHEGRRFTPFLAALFYWILFMNLFGLVPLVQLPAASSPCSCTCSCGDSASRRRGPATSPTRSSRPGSRSSCTSW
jgi:F-type H+-transporting ATPase subunit a